MNQHDKCDEADAELRKGPHALIRWRATRVDMDVRCSCGIGRVAQYDSSPGEGRFAYYFNCLACGKWWTICSTVQMVEIDDTGFEVGS